MRRFICVVLIALSSIHIGRAQISPKVDERVELACIVFRLAGFQEYVHNNILSYAEGIDRYFENHKGHPLLDHVKKIREETGLAYASAEWSAIAINISDGNIELAPNVSVDDVVAKDPRWTKEGFTTYIELLDDFYKRTDFNKFFNDQRELYSIAEERLSGYLDRRLKTEWFESFYGQPLGSPFIYIGMCNGPHNYSIGGFDNAEGRGIIIGASYSDDKGLPIFNDINLSTIIHEFGHFFSAPLVDEYWPAMESAANTIYSYVREEMWRIAYDGALTTMSEWLNNLFMVMYFRETSVSNKSITTTWLYELQGFWWLERGVNFMDNFYNNRDIYPYVSDFMPQIVAFLNFTAANFDKVLFEVSHRTPYIVNVFPAPGSNLSKNTGLDNIYITFSEPMFTAIHGIYSASGKLNMPLKEKPVWINEYTISIPVDTELLEENKTYFVNVSKYGMLSKKNFPIADFVTITYNTKDKE